MRSTTDDVMPESLSVSRAEELLNLEISVEEAAPWPALRVSVRALLPSGPTPLGRLRFERGLFSFGAERFRTDAMDTLLLRTLRQQPLGGDESYLVGARDFAGVLALLRQHSSECRCTESARVAAVEVFASPPEVAIEIAPADGSDVADGDPPLSARVRFCSAETGLELGDPLVRTAAYWTFKDCVAPPPELPSAALLREIVLGKGAAGSVFSGARAQQLLHDAAGCGNSLAIRVDSRVASLNAVAAPARVRARVYFDHGGDLVIRREALLAGREPQTVDEKRVRGDAIADFLVETLPGLRAGGAEIAPDVEHARVCRDVKPGLAVKPAEDGGETVQAEWFFEPAGVRQADGGSGAGERITPIEMVAAAARGERYLRRGNVFVRVDLQALETCRRETAKLQALKHGRGEARGEDIPELLVWARKASADAQTPWNVYVAQAVAGAHKVKDDPAQMRLQFDVEDDGGDTWFMFNAGFDHGGEAISEDELRKLVSRGQKWFRKGQTWVKVDSAALRKFDETVRKGRALRHYGHNGKACYRFEPTECERITEIFSVAGTIAHGERYRKFLDRLRGFERIEATALPAGMNVTLRDYQQQGYEWLAFLSSYGLNGILADDMGLGKTAQTICMLARLKEQFGSAPSLVVAPTSLLDNWRAEVAKFCPSLKVLLYRGTLAQRERLRRQAHEHDVVLGTYATVRNDAPLLTGIEWRYIILDEAHFIKNSSAATTKALKTIPARHRLALTGTPVQNRLSEMWSLFDFLMPGFLGRQSAFRDRWEEPITRLQSGRAESQEERVSGAEALDTLRERIRPFVLRRLKTDVAGELPPKIENDVYCGLSPEQTALYRSFADTAEARTAVNEVSAKGADGAQAAILAALMSLRKICNHADLMFLPQNAGRQRITSPVPGYEKRSGKLEALGELLQQCREGGHRALIFCQLTSMLDILGHYLTQNGFAYVRLDGETPGTMRQGLVQRFNAESSLGAFLISTRAGGTGLNLTGADTVIFYDHDWNPANDQQAQDRAYRIGQRRTVNVYRLICKGTFEEKILRRQELKRTLAASVVPDNAGALGSLSRDELLGLFTLSDDAERA